MFKTVLVFTFLYFVTQQEDLITSFNTSTVLVDPTDPQLSCVWGS